MAIGRLLAEDNFTAILGYNYLRCYFNSEMFINCKPCLSLKRETGHVHIDPYHISGIGDYYRFWISCFGSLVLLLSISFT